MEMFKIILLTVAVTVINGQVTSQKVTDEPQIQFSKPQITRSPSHQVLYSNEKVTLQCKVQQEISGLQYEWYKDSALFKTDTSTTITVADSGKYECKVKKGSSESEKSSSLTLTLQEPPKAKVESEWIDAFAGETASLQCVIGDHKSEKWIYLWFRDGETVSNDPDTKITGNSLSFTVKPHSGTYLTHKYVCQAELEGRSVKTAMSTEHLLKVYGSEPKILLKQDPHYQDIYTGEQVKFFCSIQEQTSQWKYLLNKENSVKISDDQTYTIPSAELSDNGLYTCNISRRGATFLSEVKKLTINEPPKAKVESEWIDAFAGETASLQCVIGDHKSEKWIYLWFRDGETVSNDPDTKITGNSLSFPVKPHSGTYLTHKYVCQAELEGRSVKTAMSTEHLLKVYGSEPKILLKQDPHYQDIYTGEQVTFFCSIQEQTSQWKYLLNKENSVKISDDQNYTIPSAELSDNGLYTCNISRRGATFLSEVKKLTINERPKAKVESEWIDAFAGETASLQCVIGDHKSEKWIYLWFRDGETVSNDPDTKITGNSLSFTVKPHSGTYLTHKYVCQAELEGRSVKTAMSTEHLLKVYGSEPKILLKQDPHYQDIYTGEQVTFFCSIQEQTSQWKYLLNKENSVKISDDQNYTIPSAELSDNGLYTCNISRRGATFLSEVKKLTINEPPQPKLSIVSQWKIFYKTEKVTLKCSINENSNDWGYEWYRNKVKLSEENDMSFSGNTLSISSAKTSHSGSYKCKGKHRQRSTVTTSETEALQLDVFDAAPKPKIRKHPSFEFFYTDEQVQLACEMPGVGWEYHWYKISNPQPFPANTNYIINSASLLDTGEYYCKATRGDFSIQSDTLNLQVKEPPQPNLTIASQWKTFYSTEKVTLKCSINENSNDWGYEWYRNKVKLSEENDMSFSGDTLIIRSAKTSHSGSYKCKGKHLKRLSVTTNKTQALQLNISDDAKQKLKIEKHPSFEFFYTDEQVRLACEMPGVGWEYHWYKVSNSQPLPESTNYTIKSASLSDTGEYYCKPKRADFSIKSGTLNVQVQARPPAVLSLDTEWSDIMAGNILTLRCKVTDEKAWNYTWSENGLLLNETSDTYKVKATEETIKNEFKCMGVRTERPLYSLESEGFMVNNILFKRKILLAISGCLVCCIVILIIGCIVLKITHKPEKKTTAPEDLFISITNSKNQATSPLMEYMDNKPTDKESEEKEELILDRISVTHVDGVIKGEDTPSAEANGLTSFKGT